MKLNRTFLTIAAFILCIAAFNTTKAQDTIPPELSNGNITVASQTHNSISIKWKRATDNVTSPGLLTYQIKCEGTPSLSIGPFTDLASYTITGLNPNTEYEIWVEVMDKAGNISKYSSIYVKTLSVPVTGVSISPSGTINLKVGETTTLTATVSPSDATIKSVKWSSSNTAVADVTYSSGVVSAKSVGNATITVSTNDGNKIATCEVTVTANDVGIAEMQASSMKVYPNPAQHTLYIESSEEVEQVSVYDISGRTVGAYSIRPNPNPSIDISGLANGIYLVKVKTTQGETVRKIVIND